MRDGQKKGPPGKATPDATNTFAESYASAPEAQAVNKRDRRAALFKKLDEIARLPNSMTGPRGSVTGPVRGRYTAFVTGNADTFRKAAEVLRALNSGAPLDSVAIPPGVIINAAPAQVAAELRRLGIKAPAKIPKGWRSGIFLSVAMLSRVWKHSEARLGDRLVLLAIADFANDAGEAWPSVETLAKKSRLSERETRYALRRLERSGELKTLANKGPRGCNVYQITAAAEGGQNLQGGNICRGAIYDIEGAVYDTKGGQYPAPKPPENRKEPSISSPPEAIAPEAATQNAAARKPKAKKKLADPSDDGLSFAEWFRSTLPDDSRPAAAWRDQWGRLYDDLLRLDKRSPQEIARVCQWARVNDFWGARFLSPLKLRHRNREGVTYFDAFAAQMNGASKPQRRKNPPI